MRGPMTRSTPATRAADAGPLTIILLWHKGTVRWTWPRRGRAGGGESQWSRVQQTSRPRKTSAACHRHPERQASGVDRVLLAGGPATRRDHTVRVGILDLLGPPARRPVDIGYQLLITKQFAGVTPQA